MAKMKLFPKRNKNLLPLLAVTVLVLSLALVNYSEFLSSTVENTQSVLSKSDENSEDNSGKSEEKVEERKNEKIEDRKEEKREVKTELKDEVKRELRSGKIKIDPIIVVKRNEGGDSNVDDSKDEVENESVDSNDSLDDSVETEFEQESETASDDGTVNKFKLKIKTRTVAGKTIIETASGEMEVENSPTDAVNSLVDNDILDTPTSFEAKTNDDNKVEFEVQGLEVKKLLGLFSVNLPKSVTLDADTGEVIASKQGVWTRFLSLLSI